MSAAARIPTFWTKAVLAVALVAAADLLVLRPEAAGAGLGLFALAWCAAAALATPAILRNAVGRLTLLAAVAFAALQVERATLVGWLLFGVALGVAALSPRAAKGDDSWRWLQRILRQGAMGLIAPLADLRTLAAPRLRQRRAPLRIAALGALLPVGGGLLFLWLFAEANPLVARLLPKLALPELEPWRLVVWSIVLLAVWGVLRPRFLRRPRTAPDSAEDLALPGVTPGSITLSLAVFNAVFALQNGLDLAFLWSGAPLPEGMSHAEYAHRGAYPLIATALLAGLFVVVFLRPGSPTASSRTVRRLVVLWVAQNLLLVASTVLRTLEYVEAYSLTTLRLAALLWMGLVAMGLALICWRLLRAKSAGWLIDANVLLGGLLLAACSLVDLSAVAAAWNVRHARDVGGRGAPLDVCYLSGLGDAGVVALAELETRAGPEDLRRRARAAMEIPLDALHRRQRDWRTWSWRSMRRLARVQALGAASTPPAPGWSCAGGPRPAAPLTAPAQPRT
ncbi:DUF4153 domain-containing protein [Phenylobacterium sp.]|uniref:DUF4153 domain-containing protein n=1 Tax=Phenylobacterium sp. TaxID=1871053 RepID=UPI0035AF207C